MRWRKLGHIFVADGQADWMNSHGIIPIARPLDDFRTRVYFTPRDRANRSHVGWLDIDLRRPTKVLKLAQRPLLAPGEPGLFDDAGAIGCWIVARDGIEYLFYQGWNHGVTVGFYVAVGMAVRPAGDPDRPFERISAGPLLDRCLAEPVFVSDPAVLVENGRWRMWYQSGRPWLRVGHEMLPSYDIRYAESADGRSWPLTGKPAVTFSHPGEVAIARFCPLRERDGSYSAWYSYRGNDWGYRIGYATSPDGETWTRRDDEAGITCDAGGWEGPMICYPYIFDSAIGRLMLYNGGRYGANGFGIAILEQD